MCKAVTGYFIPFWMLDISAFLLVAIAVERWRAVKYPFSNLKKTPLWKTGATIAFVIILSMITQAPTVYGSHNAGQVITNKSLENLKTSISAETKGSKSIINSRYGFLRSVLSATSLNKENSAAKPNRDEDGDEGSRIGNSCTYLFESLPMQIMHYNSFVWETVVPIVIFAFCFWQIQNTLTKRSVGLTRHLTAYRGTDVYKQKVASVLRRTKGTVNTMKIVVIAFLICVVVNQVN